MKDLKIRSKKELLVDVYSTYIYTYFIYDKKKSYNVMTIDELFNHYYT